MEMRGLKLLPTFLIRAYSTVATHGDAWIETVMVKPCAKQTVSQLMEMRGLKLPSGLLLPLHPTSQLMEMRGLKQCEVCHLHDFLRVATHGDAWIETLYALVTSAIMTSRNSWRCVD